MAEMRWEAGSENVISMLKLRNTHCWLCSAGAGRKFLLLEQGGKTMTKQHKRSRVNGLQNYSDVSMWNACRKGDFMGM